MPIPSAKTASNESAYAKLLGAATGIERAAQEMRGLIVAGSADIPVARVMYLLNAMHGNRSVIDGLLSQPGFRAYADQRLASIPGASLNDYPQTVAAIQEVHNWISSNLPKDANGYVQTVQIGIATTEKKMPVAQFNALRPRLDTLIATIG
jgi:hypothetical protein